jgi:hypothetical protein
VLHLQISSVVGDFPLVHPAMYGKPTRYAYTSVTDVKDDSAQIKVGKACGPSQPVHCCLGKYRDLRFSWVLVVFAVGYRVVTGSGCTSPQHQLRPNTSFFKHVVTFFSCYHC